MEFISDLITPPPTPPPTPTHYTTNITHLSKFQKQSNIMLSFRQRFIDKYESEQHPQNYADFKLMFESIDKNGDGRINKDEFKRICVKIDDSIKPSEINELFNQMNIDSNSEGMINSAIFGESISIEEFKRCVWNDLDVSRFDCIVEKFNSIDSNKKGFITTQDFVNNIKFVSGLDTNNNGKITFTEFKKHYSQISKKCSSDADFIRYMKSNNNIVGIFDNDNK